MHRASSLSINEHAQNIGTQKPLPGRFYESFDTVIVKKLRELQHMANEKFLIKSRVF